MNQCFGYIRVSTQKQGEGVSLEAQKDAITVFASQHNLFVSQWFEEKETAAKRGRPIFNLMLRQLKKGQANGLIMHKIDRSARNLRDWALVSELPRHGIKLYFASDNLDFESRGGRLSANLQAVIAEDFIHNLREECIKGLTGRLKQGLYPFRAPIGYLDNGRGQAKTPCPAKAPLINEIFTRYATGQYSIRSIMPVMEHLGLRNLAERPLSQHGIETILSNPFYTGLIVIKRTGAIYQGQHEPIVDAHTFQRVQDVKAGKAGKKVTRHNHLYRGLFRCGLCDGPMSPERQKGHVYYRCQDATCPTTTIREDRLADAITAALNGLELTDVQAKRMHRDWQSWIDGDERNQAARSIELRTSQAERRLNRLTDLLIDGAVGQEDFNTRKRSLKLELAALAEEQEKLAKIHLSGARMEKFLELMKNLAGLHISANSDIKRVLVENCFSNRAVVGKKLCLEPYSWLKSRKISELTPLVSQNDPLLELLSAEMINPKHIPEVKKTQQWKYNLRNQQPDDH